MFDSIFKDGITVTNLLIILGVCIIIGLIYSYAASRNVRSSRGFFVTLTMLPVIIALGLAVICDFLNNASLTLARVATIGIALGLIRFRSNNGKAEEMILLFGGVISGLILGLGYIGYALIYNAAFIMLFYLLQSLPIFNNKKFNSEKTLKITIPETLNYSDVFNEIFDKYLKEFEIVGVKTTNMGSMFILTYRIILNDLKQEKELIDELRIRNGNLEISILPYANSSSGL